MEKSWLTGQKPGLLSHAENEYYSEKSLDYGGKLDSPAKKNRIYLLFNCLKEIIATICEWLSWIRCRLEIPNMNQYNNSIFKLCNHFLKNKNWNN